LRIGNLFIGLPASPKGNEVSPPKDHPTALPPPFHKVAGCSGTGGRIRSECLAGLNRKHWPDVAGMRILAEKSNAASVFAEIRKLKSATAAPTSFYAFGRNLALISFAHQPPPYVALFRNSPFADAFRQSFETAWDNAEVMVKRCDH
jgi:hypothetical protein